MWSPATEYFILVWTGDMDLAKAVFGGILPALAGNVAGGTFLFAASPRAGEGRSVTASLCQQIKETRSVPRDFVLSFRAEFGIGAIDGGRCADCPAASSRCAPGNPSRDS